MVSNDYNKEKRIIEAALFMSSQPLSLERLSEISGLDVKKAGHIVREISQEYKKRNAGIEIVNLSQRTYKLCAAYDIEEYVLNLASEKDLSPPEMKILSLVVYKQPITKAEIIKIRGNKAYHYLKKLGEMGLIASKKHGRTQIITTTQEFKKYFEINSAGIKKAAKQMDIKG